MSLPRGVDAFCVGAAKVAVSLALLGAGFRAVSDDDYARIVIAQRFAEAPSLDPSGTSWLPLPFWIYGAAFRLLGAGLEVARAVALATGALSAVLVWVAATWVGASRGGALLAGFLAALFPWSAWLGAAALPEAPAAALVVLALAGTTEGSLGSRWISAIAVALACLCRYEAWPVAAVVAGVSLLDARKERAPVLVAIAAVALGPIALWLLHGAVRHGDALFFLQRVAAYRQALGGEAPLALRLLGPLWALVSEAPEIAVATALALYRGGVGGFVPRAGLGALALVVFLMLGELGGGGPTHHSARALLPVWYLGCVMVGRAAGRFGTSGRERALSFVVPFGLVLAAVVVRTPFPADFADRRDAVAVGAAARALGAPGLHVDTPDFSHLAVAAAFGQPNRVTPFDDRDPRKARGPDPFASSAALRQRTQALPDHWLVVTRQHAPVALELGSERASTRALVLVEPHSH